VIGTGMHGQLPVMDEVLAEARRRGVEIVVCTTPEAIQHLQEHPEETNAIVHVTCYTECNNFMRSDGYREQHRQF
jgi:hypothetical protein